MIGEALDTLFVVCRALLAWIAIGAFVAAVVLLGGTAVGAWTIRGLWRTARTARARRGSQTAASRPETASHDSPAAVTPLSPAERHTEPHAPSWARKDAA